MIKASNLETAEHCNSGHCCKAQKHATVKKGKIQLIIGPMFARKTSTMIGEIERAMIAKKTCLIIKHTVDTRYDHLTHNLAIVTHNGKIFDECPITTANCLADIDEELINGSNSIAISEGQFYTDLVKYANKWASMGKHIIIEGLSGDYKQELFEPIAKIIPYADEILHLKAICMRCLSCEAAFTIRISADTEQIKVGSADIYQAVCRECGLADTPKI